MCLQIEELSDTENINIYTLRETIGKYPQNDSDYSNDNRWSQMVSQNNIELEPQPSQE